MLPVIFAVFTITGTEFVLSPSPNRDVVGPQHGWNAAPEIVWMATRGSIRRLVQRELSVCAIGKTVQ